VCSAHSFNSHYGFEPFLQLQLSTYLVSMAYIYLYKFLVHGYTFIWYTTYLSSDKYSHLVPGAHSFSIPISSHTYTLIEKNACATSYLHTYLYILLSSILQYYDQRV